MHRELVGLEQLVESIGQVEGMPWIFGKTGATIFGTGIVDESVDALEIDGLAIIKHHVEGADGQHLLTLKGLWIGVV
jgi:hypothetical protein